MEQPDDKENVLLKMDASVAYSIANPSYYYLYLLLKDVNINEADKEAVMEEISRVREYHHQLKMMKSTAPKLNINATKNIIKNALWEPKSSSDCDQPNDFKKNSKRRRK